MSFLVLKAYLKLIHFDLYLARGNFAALYEKVRNYPIRTPTTAPDAVEQICQAVDMACIWYWKEALCLQRSAATACILKMYGVPAQMVIGAQHMPFKARHGLSTHAVQSPCLGGSGRPRRQRQTVHPGDVCRSRSVLNVFAKRGDQL